MTLPSSSWSLHQYRFLLLAMVLAGGLDGGRCQGWLHCADGWASNADPPALAPIALLLGEWRSKLSMAKGDRVCWPAAASAKVLVSTHASLAHAAALDAHDLLVKAGASMAPAMIEPGPLSSAYRSHWSALLRTVSPAFRTAAEPTSTAVATYLGTTGFPSRTGYPQFYRSHRIAVNGTLITFRSHAQLFDNLYRAVFAIHYGPSRSCRALIS
jgi:hypothetical protein